jgi:hypothetical protein
LHTVEIQNTANVVAMNETAIFIEQKRGKKKYVIFLVLGKLLKRWWNVCGSVSPSPSLKTVSSLRENNQGW